MLKEREGKLFEEEEITKFLANIIIAVHSLNLGSVYHRDLKPANILVKKESNGKTYLHLSDFGFAKNTRPDYTRDSTT